MFENIIRVFSRTFECCEILNFHSNTQVHVVPLLNDANKEKLLENFRKLIRDPLPPIRNNVVVCLTRVSRLLPEKTRVRSLLQLYAAATRDPVPDVRLFVFVITLRVSSSSNITTHSSLEHRYVERP